VGDVPGLDFILAVSDAIGRATTDMESEGPAAFDYRGQTMRYALERDLFIRLTNNAGLQNAFSTQRGSVTVETHLDDVAARVGRELGIPSVCLQQGWSPLVHTGFRNLAADRMLVWGAGFADLLRPYNSEQQFLITGSMVAAQPAPPAVERAAVGFFLQGPSPLLGAEELGAFLRLAEDVATRNPDRHVLVREHPGYPLDRSGVPLGALPNVELVPATSHRLGDVLARCRVAVSIYSTTLLESIGQGAPSVSYNMTELPRYLPDFAAEGAGIEEREHDAARAAIEQLLDDDAFLASFAPGVASMRDRYFAGAPTDAARRIAAEISGT
jgi:phosphohistidine swiveling domain-containing protein